MIDPTSAKHVRFLLRVVTLLLTANVSSVPASAADVPEPVFAANAADGDQLNLPGGCALEATRFKAMHPGRDSGIIVVEVKGGQHAFVAYPKNGRLWSHCTLLGEQDLGLPASAIQNVAIVKRSFINKLNAKRDRVAQHRDHWEIPDSRQGDTPEIQIARAARVLTQVRVKNAIIAFSKPSGQKVHALLVAWVSGVSVYTVECGSVQPGGKDFTAEVAARFAEEHLKFTPAGVSYIDASDLDDGEFIGATMPGGTTGVTGRSAAAP